jgi:hypothetical protein
MNLLTTALKVLIKSVVTRKAKELPKALASIPKWVDIMKEKILLIHFLNSNGTKTNTVYLATLPEDKVKKRVPTVEYHIPNFFKNSDPIIKEMDEISSKNGLSELYLALVDDYKICINHTNGEILLKEKLSISERMKYKAMWNKLVDSKNKK